MPPTPILECSRVAVGYSTANGEGRAVLEDVSFSIEEGDRFVLLGRSGSGKSTLLRVLNRFEEPLAGSVRFRGEPVASLDPRWLRRKVTLVQQSPVMFDGSVRDNLTLRPQGAPTPAEETLLRILADIDLSSDLLDREASTLSVGEQHRICIGRALVGEPDALLLDEPTAALDPRTAARIADLIVDLQRQRRLTTVVATHDPRLVHRLGGRVTLLQDGRVAPDAEPALIERYFDDRS